MEAHKFLNQRFWVNINADGFCSDAEYLKLSKTTCQGDDNVAEKIYFQAGDKYANAPKTAQIDYCKRRCSNSETCTALGFISETAQYPNQPRRCLLYKTCNAAEYRTGKTQATYPMRTYKNTDDVNPECNLKNLASTSKIEVTPTISGAASQTFLSEDTVSRIADAAPVCGPVALQALNGPMQYISGVGYRVASWVQRGTLGANQNALGTDWKNLRTGGTGTMIYSTYAGLTVSPTHLAQDIQVDATFQTDQTVQRGDVYVRSDYTGTIGNVNTFTANVIILVKEDGTTLQITQNNPFNIVSTRQTASVQVTHMKDAAGDFVSFATLPVDQQVTVRITTNEDLILDAEDKSEFTRFAVVNAIDEVRMTGHVLTIESYRSVPTASGRNF